MKWIKHFTENPFFMSEDDMYYILDRHGTAGTHAFYRLIEILAKNFNPESPDIFVENKGLIFSKIFPKVCHKTGKKILECFQNTGLIKYKIIGKEIIFKTNIIKDLADEYTQRILNKKNKKNRE
ncbi:hypothetical protein ES703_33200 [subsurface metagenome]